MSENKKAIILGCSHAEGAEMWLGPDWEFGRDRPEDQAVFNSFPALIARDLGYTVRNYAIGGGSNDLMFRTWMEISHSIEDDDIVIACWTGRYRSEIWHQGHSIWLQISPGTQKYLQTVPNEFHLNGKPVPSMIDDHENYMDFTNQWQFYANNDVSATNNKIKNIISLNVCARERNIRVLNFDSFDPIDCSVFEKFEWPLSQDFMDYCKIMKFPKTDWGHYFYHAHRSYADRALEILVG